MLKQVFIVDKGLKMGKGKIAGQVAHGEVMYMSEVYASDDAHRYVGIPSRFYNRFISWRYDHCEMMMKIVLKSTADEMDEISGELCHRNIWSTGVHDMGLTQVAEDSLTCIVVEPLDERVCDELFGGLKLL